LKIETKMQANLNLLMLYCFIGWKKNLKFWFQLTSLKVIKTIYFRSNAELMIDFVRRMSEIELKPILKFSSKGCKMTLYKLLKPLWICHYLSQVAGEANGRMCIS
jgi:hypothetical protein